MSNKLMSYALMAALLLSVGLLGKISCTNMNLESANNALNEQLMQADLDKGRALTQFGDANKHIEELEKKVKEEIKKRHASIKTIGKLKAKLNAFGGGAGGTIVTDSSTATLLKDAHLNKGSLYLVVETKPETKIVSVPVISMHHKDHRIQITASIDGYTEDIIVQPDTYTYNFPYKINYNLDLKLEAIFAETHTSSGAINHYVTLWELDDKGKRINKLKIQEFTVVVEKPNQPKFFWWSPHLDVGAFMGGSTIGSVSYGGSLGVSTMGHGLTKNDLAWRFLRLSLDLHETPGVGLSPALYNLGTHIPLISNMWVAPHVSYGLNTQAYTIALFLGAVL